MAVNILYHLFNHSQRRGHIKRKHVEQIPQSRISSGAPSKQYQGHRFFRPHSMNIKRIFGSVLTVLGIGGLIYAAVLFVNTTGAGRDIRGLFMYGILGLIFFGSGIGLVRTTKDEV